MRFQTVTLSEALVTDGTLVRSLAVVRPHVDRQVRLTSARLPTYPAHERLVARVDPHVIVQVTLAFEGPAAVWAAVRRLPGVDPHVNRQRAFGGEPLAALAAVVRLLVGVRSQVDLQLLARQEHFAADVAEVRSLSVRVDLLVLSQRPGKFESSPADLTAVRSFLGVGHPVAAQGSVVTEGFATLATEVRPPFGRSPKVIFQLFLQLQHFLVFVEVLLTFQGHQTVCITANLAFVRSVAQAQQTEERLSANVTLAHVTLKMILQQLCGLRRLAAHSTNTARVVRVTPGVFDKRRLRFAQSSTDFAAENNIG